MVIFCAKAVCRQLALAPIGTAMTLGNQLETCSDICDHVINLLAGQGALDAQHRRQGHKNEEQGRNRSAAIVSHSLMNCKPASGERVTSEAYLTRCAVSDALGTARSGWVIRVVLTVRRSLPVFPRNGHRESRSTCFKRAMKRHRASFRCLMCVNARLYLTQDCVS